MKNAENLDHEARFLQYALFLAEQHGIEIEIIGDTGTLNFKGDKAVCLECIEALAEKFTNFLDV